jgi:uncharacterized membrane protein YkvA (DUF1232 family)
MATQPPKGEQVSSSPFFKRALRTAEEYVQKPTRIKQLLNDAYQKASDKKDVGTLAHEAWEGLQRMFRLVRASASGEYKGLPTPTIVAAVAVLLYFLSPIDLIPDFIPVLGLLDDVALVAWFTSTLKDEMDKFEEWEKTQAVVVSSSSSASQASTPHVKATEQSPEQAAPAKANATATPEAESAKKAGTDPVYTEKSPSASSAKPHADVAANTTDSSRERNTTNDANGDTGGNVR